MNMLYLSNFSSSTILPLKFNLWGLHIFYICYTELQAELEYLSFMYTNPEDYAKIKRRVADLQKEHEKELEEVIFFAAKNY